jgi:multiple sugar transport system ATP-binding protein
MNFVNAEAKATGSGVEVHAGGKLIARLPGAPPGIAGKVVAAMRPERISLANGEPGGVPAVADLVEPTGLGTVVHLSLAGQPIKLFTTERPNLAVNQPVHLKVMSSDVRLFSPTDGKRLH